jgi:hypothetical protein
VDAKELDPVLALVDVRLALEGGPSPFSPHKSILVALSGLLL